MSFVYYDGCNALRSSSLAIVPAFAYRSASHLTLPRYFNHPYPYYHNFPYHPYFPVRDYALDAEAIAAVEARVKEVEVATSRAPIVKKEIINVPGPLGRVKTIVKRLPTPAPDVIERTFVIKPQKDTVNVLIEKPVTPPPVLQQRQVVEDPGLPVVHHKVVGVTPRHLNYRVPLPVQLPVSVPAPVPVTVAASKSESKPVLVNDGPLYNYSSGSILSFYGM